MLTEILYYEGDDLDGVAICAQYQTGEGEMIMVLGTNEDMEKRPPLKNHEVDWRYLCRLWHMPISDLFTSLVEHLTKDNWDYSTYPNPPVFMGYMSDEFAKLNPYDSK